MPRPKLRHAQDSLPPGWGGQRLLRDMYPMWIATGTMPTQQQGAMMPVQQQAMVPYPQQGLSMAPPGMQQYGMAPQPGMQQYGTAPQPGMQ